MPHEQQGSTWANVVGLLATAMAVGALYLPLALP